jgi:tetratricopeptide (TPR) repeat protein
LGRFEDAISDLSHALAIKPDLVEAYRERGRLYLVINRAAQAEEDLSLSLNSDANDFLALYYRSLANVLLKREDVAIQDATNLIQVAPSFPEAYLGRASAYLLQGKPEEAIRDCSDALRLDPELSAALSLRGKALQAIGKSAEAQRDFSYASLAKRRALIGASLQAK